MLKFLSERNSLAQMLAAGESVEVGADLAGRILQECKYQGQRPLNDERVLAIAELMEQRTFRTNDQIAFGQLNGALYLVNGYHRLNAIGVAQANYPFRVEIYTVNTFAELDALYCTFDQPGGQRSLSQISKSLGLHDDFDNGLRPATAALLIRACPLLMVDLRRIAPNNRPRSTRSLDAKKATALQWKPQAIEYQICLDAGLTSRTGRYRASGVFAVALATIRHQRDKAIPFWRESIRNSGLQRGDPRHTLNVEFLSTKRSAGEYELAEKACAAWNAWFRNRELTMCKVLGAPLKLLGTPYSGDEP